MCRSVWDAEAAGPGSGHRPKTQGFEYFSLSLGTLWAPADLTLKGIPVKVKSKNDS
jgi:hypothetical protein